MKSVAAEYPPRVALVGLMGSGKTCIGRRLARLLGYEFVDMDQVITETTGRSITEIFKLHGEDYFRRQEAALLKKLCRRKEIVVSTGGGAVLCAGTRSLLKSSFVTIWLQVSAIEAWRRVGRSRNRPLLQKTTGSRGHVGLSYLRSLARDRAPLYADTGSRVRAAGKSPDEMARIILRRLGRPEVMNR